MYGEMLLLNHPLLPSIIMYFLAGERSTVCTSTPFALHWRHFKVQQRRSDQVNEKKASLFLQGH